MTIDVNDIQPPSASPASPAVPERSTADREEIRRLAQQFEAMLLTQMLREMRRSMLDEGEKEDGFGAGALTDTGDIEFGNALSRAGGLGLTDSLLEIFERQIAPPAETAPVPRGTVRSASSGDTAAAIPISSGFGWRLDPLTGESRFHQGIDLAFAYGRDVKAAAEGTVSFAGLRNGYGNTIVIDHEDGRQTRYGHLSELSVRTGDVVADGQAIGRSGSSGRSTGPHLHFELLVDGRPVDPTRAAGAE